VALYCTGIRRAPAGSVGVLIGLDQINIELPLTLRDAGDVDVVVQAGGVLSNTARIQIL
jgi:uncharacterized protein (TIGR03437 family)